MSVLVESATGAVVLPDERHERATVNGWQAHLAADADVRAVFGAYRELASRLSVVAS